MFRNNHEISFSRRVWRVLDVASLAALCSLVTLGAAAGGGTAGPQDLEAPAVEAADQAAPKALSAEQQALEKQLRKRVQARWDATIARDFAKAYDFEASEYRQRHTAADYIGKFGSMVNWRGARVGSVRYDEPHDAAVEVLLEVSFPLGADEATTEALVRDRWVYRDKEWWRLDVEQPSAPSTQPNPSPDK